MSRKSKFLSAVLLACATLLAALPCFGGELEDVTMRARNCGVSEVALDQAKGLPSDAAVSVISPLLAACVDRLPLAPLETKLAEGIAKRVPVPMITRVLDRQLNSYRFARELLLTTVGTTDVAALKTVGDGVVEGVSRSDFTDFATSFGDRPDELFQAGLTMVSLQGQAGFDYDLTRRILDQGFAKGTLTPEWKYFVRIILAARKHSIDDRIVADAAVAVLDEGGPVSDVLPTLGFTGRDLGSGRAID